MIETILVLVLAIGLGWPLGRYPARVMRAAPSKLDPVFGPVERVIYRALGTNPARGMSWRGYAKAFALSNVVLGLVVWTQFMTQAWLPLNPDDIPNLRWDTALHTMVSFMTNSNQQHYSGQAQLSYLSQMVGIVGLQVVTPMMALALVVATLRGLFGGREAMAVAVATPATDDAGQAAEQPLLVSEQNRPQDVATPVVVFPPGDRDLGNYWADVTRVTLRFMLSLCLLWTVLLAAQGVPTLGWATRGLILTHAPALNLDLNGAEIRPVPLSFN
jgi:K+-transporting ATPase ATPase A chain